MLLQSVVRRMPNSSDNAYNSESYEKGKRSIDLLLSEHDILDYLKKEVQKKITGEDIPIQIVILAILSALLLEKPFGVLVYSASSSGKSYLVNSIVECFGPKFDGIIQKGQDIEIKPGFGFVSANSLTLAGLTRLAKTNPRCFDKKILILHEINDSTSEDVKQVTQALRQYVSDGTYDRILINEQTKKPMRLRLEGWCACISECAEQVVEVQWGNRFIFINLDESEQQNKAIVEFQAKEYTTPWNVPYPDTELFWDITWFIQDDDYKARKISVLNPWANDIVNYITSLYGSDIRIRRYFLIILRAIETLTRLHYNQRQTLVHHSGMSILVSKRWDNAKILSLFDEMLMHTLRNITSGSLDLLKRIDSEFTIKEDDQLIYQRWTVKDVSKDLGISYSSAKEKIRMLRNYGLIDHVDNEGRAYVYSLSDTGKNYSLNGRHRTTSDMMIYLPDRDAEMFLLPTDERPKGTPHPPRPLVRNPVSSTEAFPMADSKVSGRRPLKSVDSGKSKSNYSGKTEKIREYIFLWLKNAEENEMHIREMLSMIELSGFSREDGEKIIDKLVNDGTLFEPSIGKLRSFE